MNYRSFTKPYPCNIDSFQTTGLWPRPVTFESKMRPESFKTESETHKKWSQDHVSRFHQLQIIQQSCQIKTVVKFIDLQSCYLFMVQQIFMVAFMLDMHGTSNSTAMKFFPTSTSCSIQGKWAVSYLFCVHRQ